ncbi:hypothetical protein Xen7305DRAFT_00045210 [Xenococcus sp. PCC 7305]|uniref:helix-turn-helix domain-containing protein n=1 Tax=Xenococcus sp. PCC 7305 TaxID=102125 RepID=UPI0002AC49EE|nr:helix-turn-helix domain-containing protein [Xenococcus sp. PCC 7305]ELS04785.1 hypothetical protein Xen7305DRAFT_00045210 [Xenococcus sp. PCC 7305]
MPRLTPKPLRLDDEERQKLEKLLARHSTGQQIAKRAKIVLLAAQGKNHRQILRELGVSREMARLWRERWLELKQKQIPIRERLKDAERPGVATKLMTRWPNLSSGLIRVKL